MASARILFLDDDHVLRLLQLVLNNGEQDPSIRAWLAPEVADLAPLALAAHGLRPSEGATVGREVHDASIIVLRRGEITARTLDDHPSLRLVQRLGERTEGIDFAALQGRGIQLSCLPRPTIRYTAEHVLLLMLALGKKLLPADKAVRNGSDIFPNAARPGCVAYNWAGVAGATGLHGRTLGIVGLGEVGSLVAQLARAFGMTLLYHKPRRAGPGPETALGVRYTTLEELLACSDYVTLNVPDLPANHGMAGGAFFAQMKRSAYFVNTSRGQLVDEDALYNALVGGRIAGAGLDVHRFEPRPTGDRFFRLANVVLTPHLAGGARSGVFNEFKLIIENCHAVLQGGRVPHGAVV